MNLILLPGNSFKNKAWIEEVHASIKDLFNKTYIHSYDHWKTGDGLIDLNKEMSLLKKSLPPEPYVIFGKSAGVILTLKGFSEGILHPAKCMFLGTPIHWAEQHNFELKKLIYKFSIPSLFIQNKNDPLASSQEVKDFIKEREIKHSKLITLLGDMHEYPNIKEIHDLMKEFLSE